MQASYLQSITPAPYNMGMFGLGRFEELLIILLIILVLFGGKKIPELSRGIGESIKEIRKGFKDDPEKKKEKKEDKKEKTA